MSNGQTLPSLLMQGINVFTTSPVEIVQHGKTIPYGVTKVSTTTNSQGTVTENIADFSSYGEYAQQFAASLGISGKYGFYSGSASASIQTSFQLKTTSYLGLITYQNVLATTQVSGGTSGSVPQEVFNALPKDMRAKLTAINSLTSAVAFITSHGTHIITGVQQGGGFSTVMSADTATVQSQQSISGAVTGAYNSGGADFSAQFSAAYTALSSSGSASYNFNLVGVGGSASALNGIEPGDGGTSLTTWIDTITADTVCGVLDLLSFPDMLTAIHPNQYSTAISYLEQAHQLLGLQIALNNPTIVSSAASLTSSENTVTVSPPPSWQAGMPGWKILGGGGGFVSQKSSSSYLIGSYPVGTPNEITGWATTCHDCMIPFSSSDWLISNAICVYDPDDLLAVQFASNPVSVNMVGYVEGTANCPANTVLLGGGFQFTPGEPGGFVKYLVSSGATSTNNGWQASAVDYVCLTPSGQFTIYALGLSNIQDASGNPLVTFSSTQFQGANMLGQHNLAVSNVSSGQLLTGGGASNSWNAGVGNLIRWCVPRISVQYHGWIWETDSSDLDNNPTPSTLAPYSVGLSVTFPQAIADFPMTAVAAA